MLVMVIGGGQGTFLGPIIGAIVFTSIPEMLRVFGDGRMIIYALIMMKKGEVVKVAVRPDLSRAAVSPCNFIPLSVPWIDFPNPISGERVQWRVQ